MIKYRWDDSEAKLCIERHQAVGVNADLALRVYTSKLIGSDPELVMHGGGNTSCKTTIKDIFGAKQRVLCVKGSGWDLGTIEAPGLPALKLDPLLDLRSLNALSDENMVNIQRANLVDQSSPNPSIETLLHAFLPHSVIDHTHATAFLALANLPEPEPVVREIFGNSIAIVPYVMPGFLLAKNAADIAEQNPDAVGLLLLQHGHFTWGENTKESYDRVIKHTNKVIEWFSNHKEGTSYQIKSFRKDEINNIINSLKASLAHNTLSPSSSIVLDWVKDNLVISEMDKLIHKGITKRGVATPDHVIRIKQNPLVLTKNVQQGGFEAINNAVQNYIKDYKQYFDTWSSQAEGEKIMLDPLPRVVWVEGVGLVGLGKTKKDARVITDLGVQNIRVAADAENAGGFYPVSGKDLFDMEYWSLEQAKLKKGDTPYLQGKITVVTGAAGTIGAEIVNQLFQAGAEVIAVDVDQEALDKQNFPASVTTKVLDLTNLNHIGKVMSDLVLEFGGIDILISNAGIAPQSSILEMTDVLLRESFEINFFAHFNLAKIVAGIFVEQNIKGQMLFNVSKQAVNPGRNFGAYGLPKATLMFLVKQLALELGNYGIRVNGINADRIRSGILNDEAIESRADARGVSSEQYMKGNLLKEEVEAIHVAQGFISLINNQRTTGHILTVDGGNIEASLR